MLPSLSLAALVASLASVATAGDVFVHYMAQTLHDDHAVQDVQKALSLGVSAFALNVGEPDAEWCKSAIKQLFDAAAGTDFKLFFSLDLYARPDPYAFSALIEQYASHSSYYVGGSRSAPFLSTFSDAGWGPDKWAGFLGSLSSKPHFVPMFDQAPGYYSDPEAFWYAWADTLDGSFSWEQAWPGTSDQHANVSSAFDQKVMAVNHARGKDYMMGLSSLQYKHFKGQHWFRPGDVVLPERMAQILSLPEKPEFVQIQTWNDAGESHYIGHLWKEGLSPDILAYANEDEHPHEGWQPLVASFIAAFRDGAGDASAMRPQNGQPFVGSLWHHEFLTENARCDNDELGTPSGHGAALDTVNWAVVLDDDLTDHSLRVWSGGEVIAKDPLRPGLNYKAVPGMLAGEQIIQIVDDRSDTVIAQSERSTRNVTEEAWGLCNFNFQVAELLPVDPTPIEPPATSAIDRVTLSPRPLGSRDEDVVETLVVHTTVMQTVTAGVEVVAAPEVEPTTIVKATSRSTVTVTVPAAEPTTAAQSSAQALEATSVAFRTTFATKIVTVVGPGAGPTGQPAAGPPADAPAKPEEPKPEAPKPEAPEPTGGSDGGSSGDVFWSWENLPLSLKYFFKWNFGSKSQR